MTNKTKGNKKYFRYLPKRRDSFPNHSPQQRSDKRHGVIHGTGSPIPYIRPRVIGMYMRKRFFARISQIIR